MDSHGPGSIEFLGKVCPAGGLDHPFLPPELEREIFETTALVSPSSICDLLRVAQRVFEWAETMVAFLRAIQKMPKSLVASFCHVSVQNLFIHRSWGIDSEIRSIVSACSGVTNFVMMSSDPSIVPLLTNKRLQRFSISLAQLFDNGTLFPNLRHPVFAHTTHLTLFDYTHNEPDWSVFAMLPALTHLCLQSFVHRNQLVGVLTGFPQLQVLVNMHIDTEPEWGLADINARLLIDDPRFVLFAFDRSPHTYARDFEAGLDGRGDFWAHASAFVAKKRREEIKPGRRDLINTPGVLASRTGTKNEGRSSEGKSNASLVKYRVVYAGRSNFPYLQYSNNTEIV
ncbi:hypothetical protein B0H16DRAFT_1448598 [Mycena metata]|uniref:Uncharacterized protein n=1 Tax=Mycena metata TaxID=1033252 RepID=A0AAD7K625_9AGAR|nr:hypothetical protein B0H16DRAFT_1448598 [Mycena metata]